jgi:hypothetical protein
MYDMRRRLSILTDKIVEDYIKDFEEGVISEMIINIKSKISYQCSRKYIKVMGKHSVWGFIVNVHDDPKFKYGDILKAKSWRGPERNFARGNIFDDDGFTNVLWQCPL